MNSSSPADKQPHEAPNGWERHELKQLRRLAKLSFPEKLAWLEQAQRTADQLRRRLENGPASQGIRSES